MILLMHVYSAILHPNPIMVFSTLHAVVISELEQVKRAVTLHRQVVTWINGFRV
jgi:hypothetical protein